MENTEKEIKTTSIQYRKGDATRPVGDGQKVIVHVCNDIGAWGAGFVLALSKRWKQPEEEYRKLPKYTLGSYDLVKVEDDIYVCNLIGQENVKSKVKQNGLPPVRYIAIEKGLTDLARVLSTINQDGGQFSIHMPMIGSGLAGGNWKIIERIIEVTLCDAGLPVTVYQFD